MNIVLLPVLCAARKQKYNLSAVLSEINSVSWPEIEPQCRYAFTFRLDGRYVSIAEPNYCSSNPELNAYIETEQPSDVVVTPLQVDVFPDLDH